MIKSPYNAALQGEQPWVAVWYSSILSKLLNKKTTAHWEFESVSEQSQWDA